MSALTTLAALLALAPQQPKVALIQLPTADEVTGALRADVDGDGRQDLVLACRSPATKTRSLRVHLRQQRGPAFGSSPSRPPVMIDRTVVAFTFCDCLPTPGRELVLLSNEIVAVVDSGGEGEPEFRPLARHALVWPAASLDRVVALTDAVVDLDGDGREDLVLPGPDRWTAWLQGDGGAFGRSATRSLPAREDPLESASRGNGSLSATRSSLELRLGSGARESGPLVSTAARTPRCEVLDLDGDGRLDLVAHRNGRLFAGLQGEAGALTPFERALPLPEDRLYVVDPAFDVRVHDVDGDGTADLLLTTSAQRDGEVEVRVDLFRATRPGEWPARRDARLRLRSFARAPQLVDADGDGRDDLVCVTLVTSSTPSLPGSKPASIEAQLNVFRNEGDAFGTRPILAHPIPLATDASAVDPFVRVRPGRRGVPGDVLLHTGEDLVQRLMVKDGDALSLGDPIARVAIPDGTRVVALDPIGDELLLITAHEVRHVEFRR